MCINPCHQNEPTDTNALYNCESQKQSSNTEKPWERTEHRLNISKLQPTIRMMILKTNAIIKDKQWDEYNYWIWVLINQWKPKPWTVTERHTWPQGSPSVLMAANHFIRHFIQPPNFHNTDYWAGLTYINICTGIYFFMVLFMLKNKICGGKILQNTSWNYTKTRQIYIFSKPGKHSVKGCNGNSQAITLQSRWVTERFHYNTLLIIQQWKCWNLQWMSLIGKLNTLTCPASLKETATC